jgi:hypothetical protein
MTGPSTFASPLTVAVSPAKAPCSAPVLAACAYAWPIEAKTFPSALPKLASCGVIAPSPTIIPLKNCATPGPIAEISFPISEKPAFSMSRLPTFVNTSTSDVANLLTPIAMSLSGPFSAEITGPSRANTGVSCVWNVADIDFLRSSNGPFSPSAAFLIPSIPSATTPPAAASPSSSGTAASA